MQTTTAAQATSKPLIFARHLIGMGVVALANPLIYFDSQPIGMWMLTWGGALIFAVVAYGLYALFFTARAKRAWPRSFFMLAWVLLGLFLLGQWSEFNNIRSQKTAVSPPASVSEQVPTTPAFDPATARPIELQPAPTTQPHSTPSNNGLQPFNGKLDQEVQLAPFTGKLD